MQLRANNLNRMAKAEDAARALRNRLRHQLGSASAADVAELADAVAQALQAIREEL
jgi:hypothetical protein